MLLDKNEAKKELGNGGNNSWLITGNALLQSYASSIVTKMSSKTVFQSYRTRVGLPERLLGR